MINLREKAREVQQAGVAERGNFEPTGTPKRIYSYWLRNTRSKKGKRIRLGEQKENFCHFWRVVAIWAPFMFLRRTAERILTNSFVMAGLLIGIVVMVIWAGLAWSAIGISILIAMGGIIGLGLLIFGIFSGVSMAQNDDEERDEWDLPPARVARWGAIVFPAFILAYALTKAAKSNYNKYLFAGLLVLVFGSLLVAIWVEDGILAALISLGILLGTTIGLLALLIALFFLADFITGLRATRKMKVQQARQEYRAEHGVYPDVRFREPSKFKRFISSIGDLVVFVAQVVRVKKWKICPTVDINK